MRWHLVMACFTFALGIAAAIVFTDWWYVGLGFIGFVTFFCAQGERPDGT